MVGVPDLRPQNAVRYNVNTEYCYGFSEAKSYIRTILEHYYSLGEVQLDDAKRSIPIVKWDEITFTGPKVYSVPYERHDQCRLLRLRHSTFNTFGRPYDKAVKQTLLLINHFSRKNRFIFTAPGLGRGTVSLGQPRLIITQPWIDAQYSVKLLTGLNVKIPIYHNQKDIS